MKISVLSDMHFGFASGSELEMDSFDNAEEAVEKALSSDIIVLCGDIFDVRLPKTQSWANALRILAKPLLVENSGTKLVSCTKQLKEITSKRTLSHIPVVALHGNHERRARDELNTVQALENAGLLIHMNLDNVVFEKDGVKVAIHGMSNVPERYAKGILDRWNPTPLPGCFNILILHQSIDPYVFSPLEPPTISLDNLPRGFDLIINGHLHEHTEANIGTAKFLMPGSSIVTQYEKNESSARKGFYSITLSDRIDTSFVPLDSPRRFCYEDVRVEPEKSMKDFLEGRIEQVLRDNGTVKKPVVKFRFLGNESALLDGDISAIRKKYEGRAIMLFSKKLTREGADSKVELMKNLAGEKMSIEEIGMFVLRRNLDDMGFGESFDCEKLFHMMSDGSVDNIVNVLTKEQATLGGKK